MVVRRHAPRAKLSVQLVAAIKIRISNGEAFSALADEYDLTYQAIYNIAKGRSWADVPPRTDLVTRKRPPKVLSPSHRDELYLFKRTHGHSNAALAHSMHVSESVIARGMRDAKIALALRTQRLLLTSGTYRLAMERFGLTRDEAEALVGWISSIEVPKRIVEELDG
jgi:hypothetical protein